VIELALTEIGKYRVLGELGRGAMGAVYLAEDPFIGRRVAIKVMRPQVEEGSERFLREAKTVGSLSHPNIVLLRLRFSAELPYLVMEHVPGVCLDKWLMDPHDVAERLRVLAGLCRAVATLTRTACCITTSPSNVLVRADGEAKLLDLASRVGTRA
jgi:serine/threonine-protein kinase